MAWLLLLLAGCFEVGMALSLKESAGFSKLTPTLLFLVLSVTSFALLSMTLRTLPVGTAYAVWTGIGAAGTAVLGMLILNESRDLARLGGIILIISGVVLLRLAGGE